MRPDIMMVGLSPIHCCGKEGRVTIKHKANREEAFLKDVIKKVTELEIEYAADTRYDDRNFN